MSYILVKSEKHLHQKRKQRTNVKHDGSFATRDDCVRSAWDEESFKIIKYTEAFTSASDFEAYQRQWPDAEIVAEVNKLERA